MLNSYASASTSCSLPFIIILAGAGVLISYFVTTPVLVHLDTILPFGELYSASIHLIVPALCGSMIILSKPALPGLIPAAAE